MNLIMKGAGKGGVRAGEGNIQRDAVGGCGRGVVGARLGDAVRARPVPLGKESLSLNFWGVPRGPRHSTPQKQVSSRAARVP